MLDLGLDSLRGGFGSGERTYNFSDDLPDSAVRDNATRDDALRNSAVPGNTNNDSSGPGLAGSGGDNPEAIANEIRNCTTCPLCKTRSRAIPGEGAEKPLVMVIGGAPGDEEDAAGRPFMGIMGEKLDQMLRSVNLSRDTNAL